MTSTTIFCVCLLIVSVVAFAIYEYIEYREMHKHVNKMKDDIEKMINDLKKITQR